MTFVTKKVKTQTLGEYLVFCREHLRLTIPEVSKHSQIQPKFLSALEEGRYSDLPAAVYVRGFLKSLAKIYCVDINGLLEQFAAEHQIATNLEILPPANEPSKFVFPRFVLSPKTLTIFAAAVLGFLSLGYLYFQVSSLKRPPALQVFSPEQDGTVNSSLMIVQGQTEPGASVYLNNQAIVTDANGEFRENLSLGTGSNQLVIKAVNKFGQETTVNRSVLLQEKAIAGSFTASSTPPIRGLALEVSIGREAAWIYLEADGVEKFSGTMLPNSQRTITAQDKIVLTTGNAGTTKVFLNGKDLGVLGKEGEVIRDIEFTK